MQTDLVYTVVQILINVVVQIQIAICCIRVAPIDQVDTQALFQQTIEHGAFKLHCVTLDPETEQLVNSHIERTPAGTTLSMPPDRAARLAASVSAAAEPLVRAGHRIIVLASPNVRSQVRSVLETHVPGVIVLAYNEIERDIDVESLGLVHLEAEPVAA